MPMELLDALAAAEAPAPTPLVGAAASRWGAGALLAGGFETATPPAPAASMRREPPPPLRAQEDAPTQEELPPPAQFAAEILDIEHPESSQRLVDEELDAALGQDSKLLAGIARRSLDWHCGLTFSGCMMLGAAAGACAATLFQAKSLAPSVWMSSSVVALVLLAAAASAANFLVARAVATLEAVGGEMLGGAVARLGVDLLVRLGDLERNASLNLSSTWVLNLTNPTSAVLVLTRIFSMVSIKERNVAMIKMKPGELELKPESSGQLYLGMEVRKPGAVRAAFEQLPVHDWANGVAAEEFNMAVEGRFNEKDFSAVFLCALPLRLLELPPAHSWPGALTNVKKVQRSVTRGLEDLHHPSGTLNTIMNYSTLRVEGRSVTGFEICFSGLAVIFVMTSGCLMCSCLRLRAAQNQKEQPEEVSGEDPRGAAGAAEGAVTGATAAEAAVAGNDGPAALPPGPATPAPVAATPPAVAAPPVEAQSSPLPAQPPPAGRASHSPQQTAPLLPSPPPAGPRPGDDDEHEF